MKQAISDERIIDCLNSDSDHQEFPISPADALHQALPIPSHPTRCIQEKTCYQMVTGSKGLPDDRRCHE